MVGMLIAGAAASFWGVSAVLLRNPGLLGRQKYKKFYGDVRTIAHRGGRDTTPENTLRAFKNGLQLNDCIELDVWLTADDVVVVHHDQSLVRMTGIDKPITEVLYKDLPAVRSQPNEGYDQGSKSKTPNESDRIPTLEEVLDLLKPHHASGRRKNVIIEFKQDSTLLVDKVYSILEERNLHNNGEIVWFSLKYQIQKKLAAKDPNIPRITSVEEMLLLVVTFAVGILPYFDMCRSNSNFGFTLVGFDAHKITVDAALEELPALRSAPRFIQEFIVMLVNSALFSPRFYSYWRGRGFPVLGLGVNDEKALEVATELGSTAVLTDRSEWMAKSNVEGFAKITP